MYSKLKKNRDYLHYCILVNKVLFTFLSSKHDLFIFSFFFHIFLAFLKFLVNLKSLSNCICIFVFVLTFLFILYLYLFSVKFVHHLVTCLSSIKTRKLFSCLECIWKFCFIKSCNDVTDYFRWKFWYKCSIYQELLYFSCLQIECFNFKL